MQITAKLLRRCSWGREAMDHHSPEVNRILNKFVRHMDAKHKINAEAPRPYPAYLTDDEFMAEWAQFILEQEE